MKKIVLIGGTYGSGKSTTAQWIAESPHNPYKTTIVDYDTLIGNHLGKAVDVDNSDELRKKAWGELFIPAIIEALEKSELVVVPGTFSTRERRTRFVSELGEIADLTCLYFMLPMRETTQRIRRGRTDETHLVNIERYKEFYRKANKQFALEDHTDLLLPANRELLAPEYRALLSRKEHNKNVLITPHLDTTRLHHWIVTPEPLHIPDFMKILQEGINKPYEVRQALGYGHMQRQPQGFYK